MIYSVFGYLVQSEEGTAAFDDLTLTEKNRCSKTCALSFSTRLVSKRVCYVDDFNHRVYLAQHAAPSE